jgi:hypothetical protein
MLLIKRGLLKGIKLSELQRNGHADRSDWTAFCFIQWSKSFGPSFLPAIGEAFSGPLEGKDSPAFGPQVAPHASWRSVEQREEGCRSAWDRVGLPE